MRDRKRCTFKEFIENNGGSLGINTIIGKHLGTVLNTEDMTMNITNVVYLNKFTIYDIEGPTLNMLSNLSLVILRNSIDSDKMVLNTDFEKEIYLNGMSDFYCHRSLVDITEFLPRVKYTRFYIYRNKVGLNVLELLKSIKIDERD